MASCMLGDLARSLVINSGWGSQNPGILKTGVGEIDLALSSEV